jgi:plasmid stability protein
MAMVTIPNLDPVLKERLRAQAARHVRSIEAVARDIRKQALVDAEPAVGRGLNERVRARFAPLGGVELEVPAREAMRAPPWFE